MAEKLNLNRFKSSGVYTVEIDESTNLSLPIATGRLIIGSSKKGPINSVVAVNDLRTRLAVYGEYDSKLEKAGSYFHRTIDVALREGPVFALNLVPVQDTDKAYFGTFNTESASNNSTWTQAQFTSKIADFYNTQKLWFASIDQLNKTKNIALGDLYVNSSTNYGNLDKDANKILSFVNLGKKDITVWTRVADVSGYDITVKEYYALLGSNVEIPEYLNPDDVIADFFVEAIAVEGDWTDYIKLSQDPVYSQYFNEQGLIISKLNDFTALREVTVLNKVVGCIIPDFRDLTNANIAIDRVFNRAFARSGVFCALDFGKVDIMDLTEAAFDNGGNEDVRTQRLDLVGHGFDENQYYLDASATVKTPLIDVLSHRKAADNNFQFRVHNTNSTLPGAVAGQTHALTLSTTTSYTPASVSFSGNSTVVNATTYRIPGNVSSQIAVGKFLQTTTNTYVAISQVAYDSANGVTNITHANGTIAAITGNPTYTSASVSFTGSSVATSSTVHTIPGDVSSQITVGKYLQTTTNTYVAISQVSYDSVNSVTNITHASGTIAVSTGSISIYTQVPPANTINIYTQVVTVIKNLAAYENGEVWNAWKKGVIKTGDRNGSSYIKIDGNVQTVSVQSGQTTTDIKYILVNFFSDATLTNAATVTLAAVGQNDVVEISTSGDSFKKVFLLTDAAYFNGSYQYFAPNKISFTLNTNLYGNVAKGEPQNAQYDSVKRNEIDEFFKTGQYIKAAVTGGRARLLKITSVVAQKVTVNGLTTLKYTVTVTSPSAVTTTGIDLTGNTISCYKGIKNFSKSMNGIKIPGLNWDETSLYPNGTSMRQEDILNFMFEYNIASTLADGETLDFRYIIDSYEGQIDTSAKAGLVQLAADHGKCLAILNDPSYAQLERSTDPSFIDSVTKLVSAEYIAAGGDLSQNPSFQAGFASGEKNGIPLQSYAAYFMPNLIIQENGRNKSVPPAAYVSNLFMKKYRSGNTFSIAAGKRGIITDPEVVGLEYDLTNEDRDFLEPAGHNLIVRRRGFGIMVFSNNTAYQRVRSALNNIHVREALVTIEKDVERILLNFLFDFNDPITRLRVKTLMKNYLESVKDAGGIVSYELIFDESNNGVEVLENNAGIVDVIVNFPRGIHKFINRITITRANGQLSSQSSGFTPSF